MEYKISAFASQITGGQVEVKVIIVEVEGCDVVVEKLSTNNLEEKFSTVVGCVVVSVSQTHSGFTNVAVFRFSSQ